MDGLLDLAAASDDVVYAEAEAFRELGDDTHPLDVEIHTSQLLVRFDQTQPSGSFGLAMGAFTLAARRPQPHVAAFVAAVNHLSGTVDALRDVLQRSADTAGGQVVLEEIALEQASGSLAGAVRRPHPDMTAESMVWLPIVVHRVGLLPEPEPVEPIRSTRAERSAAVEAFLAATTALLPGVDDDVLRFWAQILAGYTGTDGSGPTRIGPVWLGHVLGEHVPRTFELTPAQRAGLAAAVTAWARWAARQQDLPATAVDLLTVRITEIDEAFDRVYADPDRAAARGYLSDIAATTTDGEDLRRAFALRTTAVPPPQHGQPTEQALRVSDPADRHRILAAVLESWELSPDQSVPDWLDALVSVSDQLWNTETDLAREIMDYLDLVGPDSELLGDLTELALEHGHDTTSYHEAVLDRVTPDPEDFD